MLKVGDIYKIRPDSYKWYAGRIDDIITQRYTITRVDNLTNWVYFKSWNNGKTPDPRAEFDCSVEVFMMHIEKVNNSLITKRSVIV